MNNITVIVGENAKYSIDLKDEYQSEEFIRFFEEQIQIVKKIMPGSSTVNIPKIEDKTTFKRNVLFDQLDIMVKELGHDIEIKDNDTMRTYTSIMISKNKRRGLVWLKPIGSSLLLHLRTMEYSEIDKNKKIVYSKPGKTTFGNYPTLIINDKSELEGAIKIIRYAYKLA
jgi:hypothetical protein